MSTATASHHRLSNPIAMAAAVVVIIGGATVIGVAASQSESTAPTAPAPPAHGKVANHPSRVGMGDFTQTPKGGGGDTQTLKGGHSMLSEP